DFIGCIPDSVKHFVIAGEQLILGENAMQYLKKNQVCVHNHYGPSEAHVVAALTLEPTAELPERPSIGKPLMNTRIYILNKNLNLVPKGEVGEMYIGGVQVARGYHEREKLTGEKFIILPPATGTFHESQMRLYKSGDQAKWLEDGNIEFLGRIDQQVKIRGFRVELGEIESLLLKHTGIEDAAVVMIKENEPLGNYLCAYIVPSDKKTAHSNAPSGIENATLVAEFKKYLVATLPDYMIPAHIIIMEKFPLNHNGKLDRNALPLTGFTAGFDYVPPSGQVEKKMVEIFAEILGIEEGIIGVDTSFFEMGGFSMKTTALVTKIHKELDVKVTLNDIFETPTIKGMSQKIKTRDKEAYVPIVAVEKNDWYPLPSLHRKMALDNTYKNTTR
ncbi:MAG: non-ribosomal peptide synthetase, partial [bacterium]|nr:non-ribosomal peptide synthetase [bacterium]